MTILRHLDADPDRAKAFKSIATSPTAFERMSERFQRDPDVVLAAVASLPAAFKHADEALRNDRGFAIEVIMRNCRALEFMPEAMQADRAVVMEALAQKTSLIKFASKELQKDLYLSWEAQMKHDAELPVYEGEPLRLVGFCNQWRVTDSLLRFWREPAPPGSEVGAVRHRLVAHLVTGRLSFQVLSCTQLNKFRIFPVSSGRQGVFTLVPGNLSAVEATVGDKRGGHGQNFLIKEEAGTFVSIFVQLIYGANRRTSIGRDGVGVTYLCPGTLVWYEVERDQRLLQGEVVTLLEPEREDEKQATKPKQLPDMKSFIGGPWDDKVKLVMVDEFFKRKFKDLLFQAKEMGERTFPSRWRIRDLEGDKKLALLVDAQCTRVIAYLLRTRSRHENRGIWINEFTVSAAHRGKGLGLAMLRWVLDRCVEEGCAVVQLHSFLTAERFYRKLGFEESYFPPVAGCKSMELRFAQKSPYPGTIGSDG